MLEQRKKEELLKAAKEKLLEEYKENLPQQLEVRINQIADQLSIMPEVQGLSTIEINEILRPHNLIGQPIKYTAEQLNIIFDYYRQAIIAVNRNRRYPPSKENFCAFAGISTASYNQYLMSPDEAKQEIMIQIDDYIRENMLTSAQLKEVDNITTMFRGKTGHGMVEAQAPIVIEHKGETDLSQINRFIETIKSGKSLKSIELEEKDYKMEE